MNRLNSINLSESRFNNFVFHLIRNSLSGNHFFTNLLDGVISDFWSLFQQMHIAGVIFHFFMEDRSAFYFRRPFLFRVIVLNNLIRWTVVNDSLLAFNWFSFSFIIPCKINSSLFHALESSRWPSLRYWIARTLVFINTFIWLRIVIATYLSGTWIAFNSGTWIAFNI
jgi:hypothetical protein